MSTTYGRPTYAQLIAEVRSDLNRDAKLAHLSDEAWIGWILRCEQALCLKLGIEEECLLRLAEGVEDYPVQDRPPVEGATAATPIVLTATAHGLETGDVITVATVQGLAGANGLRIATRLTADTFSIKKFARITDATNASPIVCTSKGHPFETGDSATVEIVWTTAASTGTYVLTRIDADHFSLNGSTGTDDFAGSGTASANTTGTGVYVAGGRFSREDELPTHIGRIIRGTRLSGGEVRPLEECQGWEIDEFKAWNFPSNFGAWYSPSKVALVESASGRVVRVYPLPAEDGDTTLVGELQILPENYQNESADCTIHLSGKYGAAITLYLKARALENVGDEEALALKYEKDYEMKLGELLIAEAHKRTQRRMSYR